MTTSTPNESETRPVEGRNKQGRGKHLLGRALQFVLLLHLLLATTSQAQPVPFLQVSVLTFGPGDEVWEPFGHNGLRVQNLQTGRDDVFHWGVFDFEQDDFLGRFLSGEMLYSMGASSYRSTLAIYKSTNRSVDEQVLDLSPAQKSELWELLRLNSMNPDYRYEYFLNNCSTRIRDLIDTVTDGQLQAALSQTNMPSYRFETRRFTQKTSWIFAGMDVLIAGRADNPQTEWESSFAPLVLRDALDQVQITPEGEGRRPLVGERKQISSALDRPAISESPSSIVWRYTAPLWAAAVILLWISTRRERGLGSRVAAALLALSWCLLNGVLGLLQVLLMLTAHLWGHWNENLLQFSPLALLLGPVAAWVFWRDRRSDRVLRVAGLLLALSVAGMFLQVLPGLDQVNGGAIATALPLHAALFLALRGTRRRAAPADAKPSG